MEEIWNDFKFRVLDIEGRMIPHKMAGNKRKKKAIWMNHRAVRAIELKHKIYSKYKRDDHPACIRADKTAKEEVDKARRSFETKLAKNIKMDVKSFYAYARSKSKTRVTIGPLVDGDGSVIDTDEGMCEAFNDYFASVFTTEDTTVIPTPIQMWKRSCEDALSDIELDLGVVESRLGKLREDKSMGADDLSPRLLKQIQKEISIPIQHIWRESLDKGMVPRDWKTANVTPIHKKGARSSASNYRPVSLTSQLGKLLETIIRDAIVAHLENNGLLHDSQHGFRRGRSCLSNIISFLDRATSLIDNGESGDIVYLDFAKAFDKVPIERLLKKVESHGITGKLLRWIGEWLRGREQRVCIRGVSSGWRKVTSGVPQGSVLGPVLFLIYINDLDTDILSWIFKFADDTKLLSRVMNTVERDRLQADLDRLGEWSDRWQMRFNTEKCKVMHVGRVNMNYSYRMEGRELEVVEEERDLGILVSNNLKASNQCRAAYNKAIRILGMMSRTIVYKNKEILLRLYKTLVRPLIEYCSPAWSPHYLKDKHLLERVQHRFTRMIPGLARMEYQDRLVALNLWSLEERRNRADIIETFKIVKGLSAIPASSMFELSKDTRTRGHVLKLVKHRCSTDIRKFFFAERVINRWNSLDQRTVEANTINNFKSHLERLRKTRMGFWADR